MSKLSREEIQTRINELELSDDVKISLMEDINDSFGDESKINELETKLSESENKYNELQTKYKERFLVNDSKKDEKEKEKEDVSTDEVVNITSLF